MTVRKAYQKKKRFFCQTSFQTSKMKLSVTAINDKKLGIMSQKSSILIVCQDFEYTSAQCIGKQYRKTEIKIILY